VSDATPAVVSVRDVSKVFRLYPRPSARIVEWLTRRRRHAVFEALAGISFEQRRGEGVAIIGENGAGKSTLLKLVAGVASPTSGTIDVAGRTAAILELGSGFHPMFTGRQNLRVNAALLGLTEREIREREEEIVAWSEIGDFIDRPVREYSSGMMVRLGFSIATQVDPEVLIVDEALSVGDAYFQKKSMNRMVAFVESGGTLLFCSHSLYLASHFCSQAIWLRQGRVAATGPIKEVIGEYESFLSSKSDRSAERRDPAAASEVGRSEIGPARFRSISALDRKPDDPPCRTGDTVRYEVEFEVDDPERGVHLGALVETEGGEFVSSLGSKVPGREPFSGRNLYRVVLEIPDLTLVKGRFDLTFLLLDDHGLYVYDRRSVRHGLVVESPHFESGFVRLPHRWIEP